MFFNLNVFFYVKARDVINVWPIPTVTTRLSDARNVVVTLKVFIKEIFNASHLRGSANVNTMSLVENVNAAHSVIG